MQGDNLSVGLFDLFQLPKVIPEPRLGDNVVGRKDPHSAVRQGITLGMHFSSTAFHLDRIKEGSMYALELGSGFLLGGDLSTQDRVLGESAHLC